MKKGDIIKPVDIPTTGAILINSQADVMASTFGTSHAIDKTVKGSNKEVKGDEKEKMTFAVEE